MAVVGTGRLLLTAVIVNDVRDVVRPLPGPEAETSVIVSCWKSAAAAGVTRTNGWSALPAAAAPFVISDAIDVQLVSPLAAELATVQLRRCNCFVATSTRSWVHTSAPEFVVRYSTYQSPDGEPVPGALIAAAYRTVLSSARNPCPTFPEDCVMAWDLLCALVIVTITP